MPYRAKAALVYTALAAATLWPLAHIYLVKTYDLSPWKLGGWGMYSAPRLNFVGLEVHGQRPGAAQDELVSATPQWLQDEGRVYLDRYRWMRGLAPPDAFAVLIFRAFPAYEALRLVLEHPYMDPATGIIHSARREHRYQRP